MRTYPENIEELIVKHSFTLPINDENKKLLNKNIILRHDLAFLFLKERIFKVLSQLIETNNSITLESRLEQITGTKRRKEIYNAIRQEIPFYIKGLDRPFKYYLLIILIFIISLVVFVSLINKDNALSIFSLLHLEVYGIIISISFLIAFSFDYIIGKFVPKHSLPTEYQDIKLKDFIGKIISENRKEIKERFTIIFEKDIEKINNNATQQSI